MSDEVEESLEFYLLCKGVMNIFILKYNEKRNRLEYEIF